MGGQALSIETRRVDADEFKVLSYEVLDILRPHFNELHITQAYFNKPNFGDLDVLVQSDGITFNVYEKIQELFSPTEIYKNSHVYSFDFKGFQVDLILVSELNWFTSMHYFSYNDLGNLMGRVANQMGLKYGDYGLAFKHTHNGRGYGDILISQDMPKIFEFLGFDYNRYLDGFEELEDVFEYVVNSKYFTPQLFDYENLDHQNRTRNRKRKTYQAFLDYLEEKRDSLQVDENYKVRKKGTNMTRHELENLKKADEFFGSNTLETLVAFQLEIKRKEALKEKFNGKMVMERYGLEGKSVGDFLENFKKTFPNQEVFENFLEANETEEILKRADKFHKAKQVTMKRVDYDHTYKWNKNENE